MARVTLLCDADRFCIEVQRLPSTRLQERT